MLNERLVWINGKLVKWNEASVHMMSHSFARGSTIFEVISFYRTPAGPAVFRLNDHIARLRRSAELLDMELPARARGRCARPSWRPSARTGWSRGSSRWSGTTRSSLSTSSRRRSGWTSRCSRSTPRPTWALSGEGLEQGTTAGIAAWRKLDPRTVPVAAKAAANYLNGMIARAGRAEARVRGRGHARQRGVHRRGRHRVRVHGPGRPRHDPRARGPCSTASRGARSWRSAAASTSPARRAATRPTCCSRPRRSFSRNTPFKVIPVRRIEHRELAPVPGPMQVRLAGILAAITSGANADFASWLYPVGGVIEREGRLRVRTRISSRVCR